MSISLKTHKMLWGRSANRCAICRMELVMDASETDDESIVGEACHIVGQSLDGPRGGSDMPLEQRDKYSNLILLCNVHHKQIDDQASHFNIEKLHSIKQSHEEWVKSQLGFDQQKLRDDEIYSHYIDHWAKMCHLEDWQNWSSWMLSYGQPSIENTIKHDIKTIPEWILSRVWPKRYPELESAFRNFQLVANDLITTFERYAEDRKDNYSQTIKLYHGRDLDDEEREELSQLFDHHVDLVQDLVLELTRAANYVCDMVRLHLSPGYRMKDGVLLVTSGPYMDLGFRTHRVEYRGAERSASPYQGIEDFLESRFSRDRHFGTQVANEA